jgi:hypothetical protein
VRAVFPAVVASAAFMALWVFGPFPGSAYAGASAHDRWLASAYEWLRLDRVFGPTTLLTKYAEAGASPLPSGASWPAILHAAPGALWCVIAPIQIHPAARDALGGAAHGRLGRVALALAATLMLGYSIIDRDDLFADAHDFAGRGGTVAESVDARVATFARGLRAEFDEAAERAEARAAAEGPATMSSTSNPSEAPALDAPPQYSYSSVPRFNLVGVRGGRRVVRRHRRDDRVDGFAGATAARTARGLCATSARGSGSPRRGPRTPRYERARRRSGRPGWRRTRSRPPRTRMRFTGRVT